jgi:hypothetical protein
MLYNLRHRERLGAAMNLRQFFAGPVMLPVKTMLRESLLPCKGNHHAGFGRK